MLALGIILYLMLCLIVAMLLRKTFAGFSLMFILCVILTPLIMALVGILFSKRGT